jgi:hypothetical protein
VPLRKKLRVGFYVPVFFYPAKKRDKKRAPLQPLTHNVIKLRDNFFKKNSTQIQQIFYFFSAEICEICVKIKTAIP